MNFLMQFSHIYNEAFCALYLALAEASWGLRPLLWSYTSFKDLSPLLGQVRYGFSIPYKSWELYVIPGIFTVGTQF